MSTSKRIAGIAAVIFAIPAALVFARETVAFFQTATPDQLTILGIITSTMIAWVCFLYWVMAK